MSSSFRLEVLDSGKNALISSYLDVSTTETESGFWKKLAMIQNSDYNPENTYKDEKYENESDNYGTNFEQEDYVKPERDEFNHKAWPSLSVRPTDESTEKDITSIIMEIIKTAEDDCDAKFWRDYEAKLYGKWLKIENPLESKETAKEEKRNYSFISDTARKDNFSDEFWRNYEKTLYNKWLKIDNPQDFEYIEEKTAQITKALMVHLGLKKSDRATVPTDVEENIASKVDVKPMEVYDKKVKERKNNSRVPRFFSCMFSCFRRNKDEN